MHQQLWGYKVEEKLYLGVREQKKRLNTTDLEDLRLDGRIILKLILKKYDGEGVN
jgi:hypothetical protein